MSCINLWYNWGGGGEWGQVNFVVWNIIEWSFLLHCKQIHWSLVNRAHIILTFSNKISAFNSHWIKSKYCQPKSILKTNFPCLTLVKEQEAMRGMISYVFMFWKGCLLIDRNNSLQLAFHSSTKISRLSCNICRRLQEIHPFGQSLWKLRDSKKKIDQWKKVSALLGAYVNLFHCFFFFLPNRLLWKRRDCLTTSPIMKKPKSAN